MRLLHTDLIAYYLTRFVYGRGYLPMGMESSEEEFAQYHSTTLAPFNKESTFNQLLEATEGLGADKRDAPAPTPAPAPAPPQQAQQQCSLM